MILFGLGAVHIVFDAVSFPCLDGSQSWNFHVRQKAALLALVQPGSHCAGCWHTVLKCCYAVELRI